MIIEFFGISGVGKSTIVKQYIQTNPLVKAPRYSLYEKNSWIIRNLKKLFYLFVFSITNIKWCFQYFKILKKISFYNFKDKYTVFSNGIFHKYLLKKCKNNNQKYLFDEGVFQLIWGIYLRTDDVIKKDIIEKIFELFGVPTELNIVVAKSQTIAYRLIQRGRKTKILETNDLISKIENMQLKMEKILSYAESFIQGKCQINFIDNNTEVKHEK